MPRLDSATSRLHYSPIHGVGETKIAAGIYPSVPHPHPARNPAVVSDSVTHMAALTRHAILGSGLARSSPTILTCKTKLLQIPERGTKYNKKPCQKPKKKVTVDQVMASIEAKGFLRPYKPYQPSGDVNERLDSICQSEGISTSNNTSIGDDLLQRFKLFVKCAEEFQYSIPNSRLVNIRTIGDLREFYQTPVFTTTPLEALQNMELPPNLHVQQEPVRFHPDDDRLFGGKTAFPQSATLVTGLKYKKKYRGYKPEKPWPNEVHSILKF